MTTHLILYLCEDIAVIAVGLVYIYRLFLGFPEDHMYLVLNRFLLSHQSLDFRRVPEFFKLFYGSDLEVNSSAS